MKTVMRWLLAVAAVAGAGTAQAGFNFKLTFDGTMPTQDASSDAIIGAKLNAGDTYRLDIRAAGNDFWRANTSTTFFGGMSFLVLPSATRTANAVTTFYLDGVQVAQVSELGIVQSFAHMGNQYFTVTSGLKFDHVSLDYQLLTSTAPDTEIYNSADFVFWSPFFRESSIDYEFAPLEEVPAPPALILGVFGVASLLGVNRFRRKAVVAVA